MGRGLGGTRDISRLQNPLLKDHSGLGPWERIAASKVLQLIQPWSKIVAHYEECGGENQSIHALRDLSRKIASTSLSSRLYGWTSVLDLCIAQAEARYPYDGPRLVISPLPGNLVEFRYVDTYEKDKLWHRIVESTEVVSRFQAFLSQLRWSH